eukprot:3489327-Pleurochrysis_carterae.AAC.2
MAVRAVRTACGCGVRTAGRLPPPFLPWPLRGSPAVSGRRAHPPAFARSLLAAPSLRRSPPARRLQRLRCPRSPRVAR